MTLSINQPAYLPWLGYFHRIEIADVHVILDHVQFEKNSYINRNKIRTKEGSMILTVPLKTKGLFGSLAINIIEIAEDSWRTKHFKSIQSTYAKAKYFKHYEPILAELYSKPYNRLIDLIIPMNTWFMQELNIKTKIVRSSELNTQGVKSDLVLDICKSLNASTYLSGPFGRDYLDMNSFSNAGIKVAFHDYMHPVYTQVYHGFESNMSILDLLLNHGSKSINYLNPRNEENV
jgi:hypothetical protein